MRTYAALAFLAPLGGVLLLIAPLAGQAPADGRSAADLREKVKALVRQLDDKDLQKQEAARDGLIRIGPEVLRLLPGPTDDASERQKVLLALVRQALREQVVKRDLGPRLVTLSTELPLPKALAELSRQTGITVEDRRKVDGEVPIHLRSRAVTFWEALDAIAAQAEGRVGVHESDGKIALRARPSTAPDPLVSYNGIFRTAVRSITTTHSLDSDDNRCTVKLEVAWEPRFRPSQLMLHPRELTVEDARGSKLSFDDEGQDEEATRLFVTTRNAIVFDVPLPPVDRSCPRLGLVKGTVNLIGPLRMETFAFTGTLADIAKDPKSSTLTRGGVTVKIRQVELARDHWKLVMALEHPDHGPEYDSFESWVMRSEVFLKKKGSDDRFPCNGGWDVDSLVGTRAVLSYHFFDEPRDRLVRGRADDWSLVCETPGMLIDVPVSFEFKNVPLP